jgi:hypothetical protein
MSHYLLHEQARKLFGTNYCQVCGIHSLLALFLGGTSLSMHNGLQPKDYTVMESGAWLCVCQLCHNKVELFHSNGWSLSEITDNRYYSTFQNVFGNGYVKKWNGEMPSFTSLIDVGHFITSI